MYFVLFGFIDDTPRYPCVHCGETFSQKSGLNQHLKNLVCTKPKKTDGMQVSLPDCVLTRLVCVCCVCGGLVINSGSIKKCTCDVAYTV